MAKLPLHALQGFVAAARSGNLSRAAETMHLTTSALSHQIRGLEDRLGRPLFLRNARGVSLTGDGLQLFERVSPHFDAIEQALRPFRAHRSDVLTLSLLPSMASAWLLPRLGGFLARHPQIELTLQSSVELVDFERDHDIDAALRSGAGQWPGVVSEHLFDERLVPVASPALVARLGSPAGDAWHAWPLLGDNNDWWDRWFAEHGGTPPARYAMRFDDSEALHRAAVEGVGVALARMTRARLLVENGLLVPLTPQWLRTEYAHYLVYPPRSEGHAGLVAFREWLLDQARDYAAREQDLPRAPRPPRKAKGRPA